MADGNITVEVSTKAAQAELRRLRAENAALKRDLEHAKRDAAKMRRMFPHSWRWAVAALPKGGMK